MSQPRRVVNAKGPATVLGAAPMPDQVRAAMDEVSQRSVHMGELQADAGREIAAAFGAEAAFVTGCAAAGMVVGVAAAIAGADLAEITRMPRLGHDRNHVLIQKAHVIIVGGCSADQVIRLPGGEPAEAGTAADCADFHVRAQLGPRTAAGLYVVGERATGSGTLSLPQFARLCHDHHIPVIVDAAGSLEPDQLLRDGADLVILSAHKWLRGPTAGIVAGAQELVHAAFLHGEFGVGRPMKAGKEGIAGAREAVRLWSAGAHRDRAQLERDLVTSLAGRLNDLMGIHAAVVPTEHESTAAATLRLDVDPNQAGITAWRLAEILQAGDPSIAVFDYEAAQGYLLVDPGLLAAEDEKPIADAVRAVVTDPGSTAIPHSDSEAETPPRFASLTAIMEAWNRG